MFQHMTDNVMKDLYIFTELDKFLLAPEDDKATSCPLSATTPYEPIMSNLCNPSIFFVNETFFCFIVYTLTLPIASVSFTEKLQLALKHSSHYKIKKRFIC